MQIHQSSIKATQKGVFHGYELLERTGSGSVAGLWLTALQSLRILESHLCNKGKSHAKFWPDCLLSHVEENEPSPPQGNGVKGIGICSVLLPFFGLGESPQQKQNAVTAQPKIGIWPSWGVQEPGAAVQYSMASWEWKLKITTRWLMILRAIVKLSSCDINQNMNISAVQGRKSPWRCTLGICHYWVARHALGADNFSCKSYPFGKPAFSSVRWHNGNGIHEVWGGSFFLHRKLFQ